MVIDQQVDIYKTMDSFICVDSDGNIYQHQATRQHALNTMKHDIQLEVNEYLCSILLHYSMYKCDNKHQQIEDLVTREPIKVSHCIVYPQEPKCTDISHDYIKQFTMNTIHRNVITMCCKHCGLTKIYTSNIPCDSCGDVGFDQIQYIL